MKKLIFPFICLLFTFNLFAQHTFSIVAVDTETGEVGSAGATCLDNGASIISGLVPGRGAMNSQALVCTPENLNLIKGLGMMEDGISPENILAEILANDVCGAEDENFRQYGIIDFDENGMPRSTAYTGTTANDYANHIVGSNYAIQGNILIGPEVLEGMELGFQNSTGSLADRLMAALQGANIVGADSRCTPNGTSSSGAFLRIACPPGDGSCKPVNLDVFFLAPGVEPIDTLQSLFDNYFNSIPDCPANDGCSSALNLGIAGSADSCNPLPVNFIGATESFVPVTQCDKDIVSSDLFFKFMTGTTLPAKGYTIRTEFNTVLNPDDVSSVGMAVYESCRADSYYLGCKSSADEAESWFLASACLEPETEYYLKIWAPETHYYTDGQFRLCMYKTNVIEGPLVVWGDEGGQGDFDGGLNNWITNGISGPEAEWFWDEDAQFNSLTGAAVASETRCNGAAVIHSDFLLTGGFLDNIPQQPYPTNIGELISPIINLAEVEEPVVRFTQHFGGLNGNQSQPSENPTTLRGALFSYSVDAGFNWSLPQPVNDNLAGNEFSSQSSIIEIPVQAAAGSNVFLIKFIWDGDFYFWMIDDVKVLDNAVIVSGTEADNVETAALKLIRNPVADFVEIQFSETFKPGKSTLRVFDVAGGLMMEETFEFAGDDTLKYDVARLNPGIYFIKIEATEKEEFVLKFIKN